MPDYNERSYEQNIADIDGFDKKKLDLVVMKETRDERTLQPGANLEMFFIGVIAIRYNILNYICFIKYF